MENVKFENGKSRTKYEPHAVLPHLSMGYSTPRGKSLRVTQPFASVRRIEHSTN